LPGRRAAVSRFGELVRNAGRSGRAEASGAAVAGAPVLRRAATDRKDLALAERRDGSHEERRAALTPAPQPPRPAETGTTPADLRSLVRALPVAIDASALRAGAPLALAFGRSLDVELRPAPGGIELVLRADRRLAVACADGLPELVAALGRRGIAVKRAEVRPRGGAAGGARVDLPPPLR
jgi:hypothetical protein